MAISGVASQLNQIGLKDASSQVKCPRDLMSLSSRALMLSIALAV
jgi:hypothetical protein